jgi:DNA-binding NtrC family response regulator
MARVLIVDDNASQRLLLFSVLGMMGCETSKADDAFEALDILRNDSNFDVILTDIRLPKMNGLQLLDELKAHHPHIPVIVISAYNKSEREPETLRKGAFGYLQKPFHICELTEMVQQAMQLTDLMGYPLPEPLLEAVS